MKFRSWVSLLLIAPFLWPLGAKAALSAPFEVSGWIPYWRSATGTAEFLNHIDDFKEINPFGYTVKSDGTLNDAMDLTQAPWPAMVNLMHLKQIRIIPTVMWSDAAAIDRVLRNPELRAYHENQIVNAVYQNGFDGIDIDYEAKYAETKNYFSLFLRELYAKMGKKWVECTIEARTPQTVASSTTPAYANDYPSLNKYCDRIRIMAYDQASVDKKLTSIAQGPYVPVADPKWVDKVLNLAELSFPKSKIMLGIATYGYEFKVSALTSGYNYKLQWAFNPKYAQDLAASLGITPGRNTAGELSFIYKPESSSTASILDSNYNIVWWSDAQAIADKIALAKKHGIRGISIFKIDGGADPALWTLLQK